MLASTRNAKLESFVYIPPEAAFGAARILIKPNLAYPQGPPITVSMTVLEKVLRGIRRVNPHGRIVVADGVTADIDALENFKQLGLLDIIDNETRVADAETLLMTEYQNTSPNPAKYQTITAPGYIKEYDCCIVVSTFKRTIRNGEPFVSASINSLVGLLPRSVYHWSDPLGHTALHEPSLGDVLKDIYYSIGYFFHGAVVDLTYKLISPDEHITHGDVVPLGQVVWGDNLIAVDEAACRLAGEPLPGYLKELKRESRAR
ncbi:MAG: hypothetical protein CUN56_07195 [Phototrophicales bacterium]|nr:MAG: hypothetical protein CUN56_07195 [Phototrophicales bacterium]RMG70311.1 MAG: DUF362 domain-containing protein [Chloroflexota bacterium]